MLSEFAQAILKNNKIDEDLVESVDTNLVITYKDGTRHQLCEVWSRVMGYYRPQSEYNVGKKQEHTDRVLFNEPQEIVNEA